MNVMPVYPVRGTVSNGVNEKGTFFMIKGLNLRNGIDSAARKIIMVVFFAVPLLMCRLFFDVYAVKLWFVQISTGILCVLFFLEFVYGVKTFRFAYAPIVLLSLFFAINAISWLRLPLLYRNVGTVVFLSLFFYILLALCVSQYIRKEKDRELVVVSWVISAVIISIYAIKQRLMGSRVIGTLGNENFLASHIAYTIPVAVGFFVKMNEAVRGNKSDNQKQKSRKNVFKQSGLLICSVLIIVMLLIVQHYTNSRGSWVGLLVAAIGFIVLIKVPQGKRFLATIVILLLLLIVLTLPWVQEFISFQFIGGVRIPIWEGTLNMLFEKPFLGWGKGAYFIYYPQFRVDEYWLTRSPTDLTVHAHNEFLQIWAESGLVGLLLFIALIISILKIGVDTINKMKNSSERYIIAGLIAGVIGLLTHNLVCNNLQMPSSAIYLWLGLGLILGASKFDIKKTIKRLWIRLGIFLAIIAIMAIIIGSFVARPAISQYWFKKGLLLRNDNKWTEAIAEYEKAISCYPWDVEMRYRSAFAYARADLTDKAIERYQSVCLLANGYGNVYRNIALLYLKKQEYKKAKKFLLQALRINPYDMMSLYNLQMLRKN